MRVGTAVKALVVCGMGIYALASTPTSAASPAALTPCFWCGCPWNAEQICSASICQGEPICWEGWGTDFGCGVDAPMLDCGAEQ